MRAVRGEITALRRTVMSGTRIMIHEVLLQRRVQLASRSCQGIDRTTVQLASRSCQGIARTKAVQRTKVWLLLVDKVAQQLRHLCHECQLVSSLPNLERMIGTELPEGPWQLTAADLLCPLPYGDTETSAFDFLHSSEKN